MKKLFIILTITLIITGCATTPLPDTDQHQYTVEDYFPFLENTKLSYAGEGNEYAEREVYFDFIEGNRAQIRMSNPGTTLAQVYEVNNGEVRLLSSTEEMYVFYNTLESLVEEDPDVGEVLLKEPFVKGTKWTLPDGGSRQITGVKVSVDTPHATYEAIEVTTIRDGETSTIDYYAVGIGLVKSIFTSDKFEVVTALKAVEENTTISQVIRFYYPDFNNEVITFVEEKVLFETNDDIKELFQNRLKQAPGEDVQSVIGKNVKIIEIIYNREDWSVTGDFNRSLVTEMNAGVFLEGQILSSIATTLGGYFNVPKVYIRIDGKPYESGHVLLEEDDYLTPRIDDAIPYKRE